MPCQPYDVSCVCEPKPVGCLACGHSVPERRGPQDSDGAGVLCAHPGLVLGVEQAAVPPLSQPCQNDLFLVAIKFLLRAHSPRSTAIPAVAPPPLRERRLQPLTAHPDEDDDHHDESRKNSCSRGSGFFSTAAFFNFSASPSPQTGHRKNTNSLRAPHTLLVAPH